MIVGRIQEGLRHLRLALKMMGTKNGHIEINIHDEAYKDALTMMAEFQRAIGGEIEVYTDNTLSWLALGGYNDPVTVRIFMWRGLK